MSASRLTSRELRTATTIKVRAAEQRQAERIAVDRYREEHRQLGRAVHSFRERAGEWAVLVVPYVLSR